MEPLLRAAIIVAELPADLAATLTRGLPPLVVPRLAAALPEVLKLSTQARSLVLRAFLLELGARTRDQPARLDRGALSRLCRRHAEQATRLLAGWVDQTLLPDGEPSPGPRLPGRQASAVLLMSLPPEVSAQLFQALGPDEVQAITMEIARLPAISPEVRQELVQEFCEAFGFGPGSLEEQARSRPQMVATGIHEWLARDGSPHPPAQPASPREQSPPRRTRRNDQPELTREGLLKLAYPESLGPRVDALLRRLVHDLGASWRCAFPPLELQPQRCARARLSVDGRVLMQFRLDPELYLAIAPEDRSQWILPEEREAARRQGWRIQSPSRVLHNRLGVALAELVSELHEQGPRLGLGPEALVTTAVLRNFHPNELVSELNSLTPADLARVTQGYLHCLGLSEEEWERILIESAQVPPRELLEQARLAQPFQERRRVRQCALILRQLESSQAVWAAFWELLKPPEALQVAERLHRLLLTPQREATPQETFETLAEFSEWRTRSSRHPGTRASLNPVLVAQELPRVWPWLTMRGLRHALLRLPPASLARQLVAYLREAPSEPYLPGPLRAAHLVSSLPQANALRRRLGESGYPVPRLPADPVWQARAREEWARRAHTLARN